MPTFRPFKSNQNNHSKTYMLAAGIVNFYNDNGKVYDSEKMIFAATDWEDSNPREWASELARNYPEVNINSIEIKCFMKHEWDKIISGKKEFVSWNSEEMVVCLT